MHKKTKGGFTLVELIVVIVILAILGTISFISLQGYTKKTRDSARIADISNIGKALELSFLKSGQYPTPTDATDITFSGSSIVWSQGTFGDSVVTNVGNFNKKPVDQLTDSEYTYSVLGNGKKFEIAGVLEGETLGMNITSQALAGDKPGTTYSKGTYNGIMTKISDGGLVYILALPSIITKDFLSTDVMTIISNNKLVYNGYDNLPASFEGTIYNMDTDAITFVNDSSAIVYSGSQLPSTSTEIKNMISSLQLAYGSTELEGNGLYAKIIATNISDSNEVEDLGNILINESVGNTQLDGSSYNDGQVSVTCEAGEVENEDGVCELICEDNEVKNDVGTCVRNNIFGEATFGTAVY